MRVLFYIHHLGNGGAERVTSTLANELSGKNHHVGVMLLDGHTNSYSLSPSIDLIHVVSPSGTVFRRISKYRTIRRQVKQWRPDVIIAVMPYNFVAIKVATLGLGIPIIVSDHTNFTWNANRTLKFIRYYLYRLADGVTVLSENDREFMKNRLHNMKVMYNPLSFERLKGPVQRQKTVLGVGRLSVWNVKGFDLLIRVWGKVSHNYPDWSLQIAGDGSESDFAALSRMIEDNNVVESVQLLGFCDNIGEVMQQASVFALSSRVEGFPCSLLEAMSQGLSPVAFSIHGIISEIISDGEDGFIVNDGDIEGFARKLDLLMKDDTLRSLFSSNAIESMARFEPSIIVSEWENYLQGFIRNN